MCVYVKYVNADQVCKCLRGGRQPKEVGVQLKLGGDPVQMEG